MLQSPVEFELHFNFSLLDVFILVWNHITCGGRKTSQVNQVKVQISYKTTQCALLSNCRAAQVQKQTPVGKQWPFPLVEGCKQT